MHLRSERVRYSRDTLTLARVRMLQVRLASFEREDVFDELDLNPTLLENDNLDLEDYLST